MGRVARKNVVAVQFLRKLRGGSQPILVQASDSSLYVVKFTSNLQGENLAFNEGMGYELLKMLGLPMPQWTAVTITNDFLDRNPQCWLQTENGARRPRPDQCFGSRFLGLSDAPLLEILSGSSYGRIRNRKDFGMVLMLDILCGHADNRQALFLEDEDGWLDAYFIDNGHMFGGPGGTDYPGMSASHYLDPRIYGQLSERDCICMEKALKSLNRLALTNSAEEFPDSWKTTSAMRRFQDFLERASDDALLCELKRCILAFAENEGSKIERIDPRPVPELEREILRGPIPPARCNPWRAGEPGRLARA